MAYRPFWLLATGTGRCGTGWFSQVLTSAGVQCSHEGVFRPVSDSEMMANIKLRIDPANTWWGWEAESSWLAAPFLALPELEGITIVHLVRHPKQVIDSQMRIRAFKAEKNHWRDWQLRWLPELGSGIDEFHQAALFYVKWNQMIEPFAHYRHRTGEDSVLKLLGDLGIDWREKKLYDGRNYNSRYGWGSSDVDLDDLQEPYRRELREITERYDLDW